MLESLHRRDRSSLRSRAAALAFLVAGLLFVSACGEARYRMGRPLDTGALERSLQVGQSTEKDVREALGEPDGVGRYLPPIDFEPRRMWAYYHEEGTLKEARRTMLFVLFRNDRYDGYLWFSSLLEGQSQASRMGVARATAPYRHPRLAQVSDGACGQEPGAIYEVKLPMGLKVRPCQ